jgi:transcriptional antiterminator RfaH
VGYWCCARTENRRETMAVRFLHLAGYSTYLPFLREQRTRHGRRIEAMSPLFANYIFVWIEQQWHRARWTAGVTALIMDGERPAVVSDHVINGLREREIRGALEVPRQPLKPGVQVRVLAGPLQGQIGVLGALRPRERVLVLMSWLRVELPKDAIEVV